MSAPRKMDRFRRTDGSLPPLAGGDPVLDRPMDDLRVKLRRVEDELHDLRDRRAVKKRDADAAKTQFAATPGHNTDSAEFKSAEAAVAAVKDLDGKIRDAQAAQVGILKLMGQEPEGASDGDARELERLKSQPGRWLAAVLDRRKGEIQRLPDEIRFKTLTVGSNVSTVEESAAVIDLLTPMTVAAASGIRAISTGATEMKVPRFTTLPVADWIAELGEFPVSDPGLELVTAKPPKVGLVSGLSIEAFDDLSPETFALAQTQLLRAVALAYDKGLFFGSGTAPEPRGVANTTGVIVKTAVPKTLLGLADSIAALIATNARPGALILNPADFGELLGLTQETGSAVPLWNTPVTGGAVGLRLPYWDVPTFLTAACPVDTAPLYDPATITAVVRKAVDVAIDPFWDFGKVRSACGSTSGPPLSWVSPPAP
jgi:HK97 family phage major capsid protein